VAPRDTDLPGVLVLLRLYGLDGQSVYGDVVRTGAEGVFEFHGVPAEGVQQFKLEVLDPRVDDGDLPIYSGAITRAFDDCFLPPRVKRIPLRGMTVHLEY
jgi:hypothetical protein